MDTEILKRIKEQDEKIQSLENEIRKIQAKSATPKGWIRATEMRKMLGATDKNGNFLRPMSHIGFMNLVKNSGGEYEIRKIGKEIWVVKYPDMNRAA